MKSLLAIVLVSGCAFSGADPQPDTPIATTHAPARTYANPVRVDFMVRGYFYAGAEKSEGLGGYATSNNMPHPIAELKDAPALAAGVQVLALTDQDRAWGKHDGFRVIVANNSADDLVFAAQDSRLDIVHEAIDGAGAWKPIEYLPHSWCGNSYHQLTLPAHTYWEFVAPRYDGDVDTKLRIAVTVGASDHQRVVYSNEFLGRIDAAQLGGAKQGHRPANIMDPYDE